MHIVTWAKISSMLAVQCSVQAKQGLFALLQQATYLPSLDITCMLKTCTASLGEGLCVMHACQASLSLSHLIVPGLVPANLCLLMAVTWVVPAAESAAYRHLGLGRVLHCCKGLGSCPALEGMAAVQAAAAAVFAAGTGLCTAAECCHHGRYPGCAASWGGAAAAAADLPVPSAAAATWGAGYGWQCMFRLSQPALWLQPQATGTPWLV